MITKSLTNGNKTTASFTSSGRINSYGLSEAIKAIPPSVLTLPAANTLLRVCADACASSSYRLFKSLDTMCEETFQSANTVRTHLKQAVKAGILSRREVFKDGRQMTNEYTFTKQFLIAASSFRRAADNTKRSCRDMFRSLLVKFMTSLLAMTNRLFCAQEKAPQVLDPRGGRSCTQLLVSSDHQKEINTAEGNPSSEQCFEYHETPGPEAVEFNQIQRERSDTRRNDAYERGISEAAAAQQEQMLINKAATNRAMGWVKAKTGFNRTPGNGRPGSTSHNHAKYKQADLDTEQNYRERASIKDVTGIGTAHLAAIRATMLPKRNIINLGDKR